MVNQKIYAIVPAAGMGMRANTTQPKQFLSIGKHTIIEYALAPLIARDDIEKIVVVLNDQQQWRNLPIAKHPKIITTQGGDTRSQSVLNGLAALAATEDDWIVVHDAARPCLSDSELAHLLAAIADHPVGGLLATPVRDTLKKSDAEGCIENTVDRSDLWQAQTPQCFRFGLLQQALTKYRDVTDESEAVERLGYRAKLVPGLLTNFKVTHPEDIQLAQKLVRGG